MSMPNRDKPAFPPNGGWRDNDPLARGLSKREHMAAMALQGILADTQTEYANPALAAVSSTRCSRRWRGSRER